MKIRKMLGIQLLLFGMLAFVLAAVSPKQVFAASSLRKNIVGVIYGEDYYDSYVKTEAYCDLTGDGKKELLEVDVSGDEDDISDACMETLYIAGHPVLYFNKLHAYCSLWQVDYVQLNSKAQFILVRSMIDDGTSICRLYRYNKSSHKLICVKNWDNSSIGSIVKVKSNTLYMNATGQWTNTGWIRWVVPYKYKKGKLTCSQTTFTAKRICYSGAYSVNFKTARRVRFYTSTSLKKTAFTVSKGKTVKLKKLYVRKGRCYVQFSYGKKTGWIRCTDSGSCGGTFSNAVYAE